MMCVVMTDYLLRIMQELEFDDESADSLYKDLLKIYSSPDSKSEFERAISLYQADICTSHTELLEMADRAADIAGVHRYSAELLLYLCLSKHLKEIYIQRGIDLAIWHNSMLDLKWKLLECKAVKGVVGSFVARWFAGFFKMTRFALGRLQFELVDLKCDYEKGSKSIKQGSKVINVHIPRTLTPLDKESCDASYNAAKSFFANDLEGVNVAFVCHSWLLFPDVVAMCSENSNIYRFAKQFDIVDVRYDNDGEHPDAWRLFDTDYNGNIDELPGDSSLRRAYKEFIRNGGRTGNGFGIFFAE